VTQADSKLTLITLLIELGVAAAVSSSLARSVRFKRLLLMSNRTPSETLKLVAMIAVPLTLGVWIRVTVPNFLAADISFEATMLLGLLLGPGYAMLGGAAMALPAVLHHEYWALPVNLLVAAIAGGFGRFADEEDIWLFSPLIDLSIYRWIRRNLRRPHLDRQLLLLLLITAMQFCTSMFGRFYPKHFFELYSRSWAIELAICASAPVVVGIPLKIWNAIRIERQLEEQGRLLLEARLDALQRQINPHFLFNTLNSITSLVRSQPELAREMIVKLANILRVLLKDREAFVPFSEELAFTDDYLDIEVVRFGPKLRVVKEIAEDTLHVVVPSMLLQPLIENSIKHGLEPRISGGMAPERDAASPVSGLVRPGTGIGMRNVRERMEVLYGHEAEVSIVSRPGRGTKVLLVMPILDSGAGPWAQLGAVAQIGWGAAVKAVTRG
jgi:two-component system LytT family sensor kinase